MSESCHTEDDEDAPPSVDLSTPRAAFARRFEPHTSRLDGGVAARGRAIDDAGIDDWNLEFWFARPRLKRPNVGRAGRMEEKRTSS